MAFNSARTSSMSTTDDAWCTDTFSCLCCWRARRSLGCAQNCLEPTGLQRSLCTLGAKGSHRWWQSSLYRTLRAFLVSIWHVTLIKESSFGAETWLITQNLKPERECVTDKLSSPTSKENGSIVIIKDDHGELCWDHKHVLVVDFLYHADTLCWLLLWYIFHKRPRLLCQSIVLLQENSRHHTTNWTAVYGCTSDRLWINSNLALSVLSLTEFLRSTRLANDCSRYWCEASYHLLATVTRQQCLYPVI